MRLAAAACWLLAGCGYLVLEAIAAAGYHTRYGYAANMISDLGRPDLSALAPLMNVAFVLQGTLFLVAAVLLTRAQPFVGFAAANAVGNVVVAVIHSGSPVHVAGAVLAIVGGNAAILAGYGVVDGSLRWYRSVSLTLAAVGLVAFAVLAIAPNPVAERVSVYTIVAWQVISAIQLLRTRGAKTTQPC